MLKSPPNVHRIPPLLGEGVVGAVVGPLLVLSTILPSKCRSFLQLLPLGNSSSCPCCNCLPASRCFRWGNLRFLLPHLVDVDEGVVEVEEGVPLLGLRRASGLLLINRRLFKTLTLFLVVPPFGGTIF